MATVHGEEHGCKHSSLTVFHPSETTLLHKKLDDNEGKCRSGERFVFCFPPCWRANGSFVPSVEKKQTNAPKDSFVLNRCYAR